MQEGWVGPWNVYANSHVMGPMREVWVGHTVLQSVILKGDQSRGVAGSQISPITPMKVFLSYLLLSQTLILCLSLTGTQSHLGMLFLAEVYHVCIHAPQPAIPIPLQAIPSPCMSTHSGTNCSLFHANTKLCKPLDAFHVPSSARNAFFHHQAHWTLFPSQELEHHFLRRLLQLAQSELILASLFSQHFGFLLPLVCVIR